jgi:murein DD-endopeptidase MepM/ murein hydrolase activator NlpD
MRWSCIILCTIALLAASCTPALPTRITTVSPLPQPTRTSPPVVTEASNPTDQPLPTALPTAVTSDTPPRLCSPLQDIALEELPGLVSNPYSPPTPGSDDPHQGVDLAVRLPNSDVAVAGHPVQAALGGKIAAVIIDRFPYGNAVIIETPLEEDVLAWWAPAQIPTLAPTLEYLSALTCPMEASQAETNNSHRSLYTLYAHLLQPVENNIGDPVPCGQVIGAVGDSGNALTPHLHFETRVGPSGMSFASMAHYDNSATSEEMSSYCLWRISGLFQLVDPLKVLTLPIDQ